MRRDKGCKCTYSTAKNDASVRAGVSMSGALKDRCVQCQTRLDEWIARPKFVTVEKQIQWIAIWGSINDLYGIPAVNTNGVFGRKILPTKKLAEAHLDSIGWLPNKFNGRREKGSYTIALVNRHEEVDKTQWVSNDGST